MKYRLILSGAIKEYYNGSGDAIGRYECVWCGKKADGPYNIKHSKRCITNLEGKALIRANTRREEIRTVALSKLTKSEKRALGI